MIVWSIILVDLAVVILAARARHGLAELPHAAPVRLSPQIWSWLPAAAAVALVAGVVLAVATARRRGVLRPLLELVIFYPALLGGIWLAAPTGGLRLETVVIGVVLVAAAAWLIRTGRREAGGLGFARATFGPAVRALAWPTAGMAAVIAAAAVALGPESDGRALWLGLVTYPLYALGQMLLFLALPVPRLRRLGASRAAVLAGCAVPFALVHWPNPVVMLASLAGMTIWAAVYLRHRNVWAIALSMGLVAALFAQLMPNDLTQHLRVGPPYVRTLAVAELGGYGLAGEQDPLVRPFVSALYPVVLGRPVHPAELDVWERDVAAGRRVRTAWQFLSGRERQEKHPEDVAPEVAHWSHLSATWRTRILAFGNEGYLRAHGGTWRGFLAGIYADILDRAPGERELDGWRETLIRTQRERIVEVMLERRRQLAHGDFTGIPAAELELP